MTTEKRERMSPVPKNYRSYMNDAQQCQLRTIEGFGWNVLFIRRPMFNKSVVVVTSQEGNSLGILEEDGRLNLEPNIEIRP